MVPHRNHDALEAQMGIPSYGLQTLSLKFYVPQGQSLGSWNCWGQRACPGGLSAGLSEVTAKSQAA